MSTLIAVAVLVALLAWFLGFGKRTVAPAPEDDIDTPIDADELEDAERELRDDRSARPITDTADDSDDDWGPGTGRSGLPGVM